MDSPYHINTIKISFIGAATSLGENTYWEVDVYILSATLYKNECIANDT